MRKLAITLALAAILAVGVVGVAFAQAPSGPSQGGGCGGFAGGQSTYDPASSPIVKKMADKIGIPAADLVKQVKEGKSVAEVAQGKGVGVDALVEIAQAPMVEMMGVMGKYGYADQDQIDSMLQYMSEYTRNPLEKPGVIGTGMMGGSGMMGGNYGGMMGGWKTRAN